MAMTIDEIAGILDQMEFKYAKRDDHTIALFMRMKTYENPENGEKSLLLVAQLLEDGEYFQLFSPKAFVVKGEHQDAFLRACAIIQWRTKLIQFEWDRNDGEVRPVIEFPLEDAKLTRKQFERCIQGMCSILDEFYPKLKKAADEGIVDFPDEKIPGDVGTLLDVARRLASEGTATPEQTRALEELLRRIREGGGDGGPDAEAPREL